MIWLPNLDFTLTFTPSKNALQPAVKRRCANLAHLVLQLPRLLNSRPRRPRRSNMPLVKSKSPEAFRKNVKAEIKAGKPVKQAVAIAYAVKRAAPKGKK